MFIEPINEDRYATAEIELEDDVAILKVHYEYSEWSESHGDGIAHERLSNAEIKSFELNDKVVTRKELIEIVGLAKAESAIQQILDNI